MPGADHKGLLISPPFEMDQFVRASFQPSIESLSNEIAKLNSKIDVLMIDLSRSSSQEAEAGHFFKMLKSR